MSDVYSGWLKALDIKGSAAAAAFTAATALYIGADQGWLYLDELPKWIRAIFAIVAILSLCLLLARTWDWGAKKISTHRAKTAAREAARSRQEKTEADTLAFLDTLSTRERDILSYLVMQNQQSFLGTANGGYAAPLVHKGLLIEGGGTVFDCAFTVPTFVWREMMRRKREFQTANLNGPQPWRIPVM